MTIITMQEYETMKVYELPNRLYNQIVSELAKAIRNERVANRVIERCWHKTIREMTLNRYFDLLQFITIL